MSSEDDKTPVDPIVDADTTQVTEACPECGGDLLRLADFIPQPKCAGDANVWQGTCISNQANTWNWCPRTGFFTGRLRVNWG